MRLLFLITLEQELSAEKIFLQELHLLLYNALELTLA